ncbi:hypothetical protein D9613_010724 [Agrocybe pediades]|uniref:Uncharacterized protein n=1 Tax=Agrocybe pediades TaxID=84607 RepID=A0A8H4QL92_9AGAR|nr:hypothetical protein D9613_010724 [Agrocybe pediades]
MLVTQQKALSIPTSRIIPHSYLPRIRNLLWRIFDNVILLQMGSTYFMRFEQFSVLADAQGMQAVWKWREEQQDEWNRLSTTLALLATMQAAILAIGDKIPELAFSLWLGGASLSVCGVFVVQYFPIKAFAISDVDMAVLVRAEEHVFIQATLLATAVASPVVILLWATILFVLGMFDYIAKSDLGGLKYRLIAGIPLGIGVLCMVVAMAVGEVIEGKLRLQAKKSSRLIKAEETP